jgi:ParB-like chromosome segregation protein Spo0J
MDTVGIDQIDVNDRTYCISYPLEDDLLTSSIARFGILVPLGMIDRKPLAVVTGFKRMEAARRLGIKRVPHVFLNLDDRGALLASIGDNMNRSLNTVEKACCVEKMDALGFPKEDIYEMARLLGLPARGETLKAARAMNSMEDVAKALVARHNLPLPVVEELLWFDAEELAAIVRLVGSFRSTTGLFREVVRSLALLKTRKGRIDFQELEKETDMEGLRQSLRRATHPLLSRLDERLDKIREKSDLPPHIRVKVDPVFERESIDIHVRARSQVEVDEALERLEALSQQGFFRSIFELTHGSTDRN